MNRLKSSYLLLFFLFLLLPSCGGGGGSGGAPAQDNMVTGTASKGLIRNGTVKIYALRDDGTRGDILDQRATDGNGRYTAHLGSYSGPILAVAFGSYTDEANPNQSVTLIEDHPLRAALPAVSGTVTLAVTGLTELAVRKAGVLTPGAIMSANAQIRSIFKLDVTSISPVEPSENAMSATGVTSQQRDYTLALAALSQLAASTDGKNAADRLDKAIDALATNIQNDLAVTEGLAFSSAMATYLANNQNIKAVINQNGGSSLSGFGGQDTQLLIHLKGTKPLVYGFDMTITLPRGVTVMARSDGTVTSGVLWVNQPGALLTGNFIPGDANSTIRVVYSSAAPMADDVVLVINLARNGVTVPDGAFSISTAAFKELNGLELTGVTPVLEVNVKSS